ncbi:MAG: hypothetical protein RIQ33_1902 [Bacteroidota bacterium]
MMVMIFFCGISEICGRKIKLFKMKFQLFPKDEIIYESNHFIDELIERFDGIIEHENTFFLFLKSNKQKPFLGFVKNNTFEVNQIIDDRKSLSIAKGELQQKDGKTIVNIRFGIEISQLLILFVISGILLIIFAFTIFSAPENFFNLLSIPIVVAFLWCLMNVMFISQVKKMKETFSKIFEDN